MGGYYLVRYPSWKGRFEGSGQICHLKKVDADITKMQEQNWRKAHQKAKTGS